MPAPHVDLGQSDEPSVNPLGRRGRLLMRVLWPSFVMAGVLEGLVFSMVDPSALHTLGGQVLSSTPQAVYTVAFMVFWLVLAVACGLTALLMQEHHD